MRGTPLAQKRVLPFSQVVRRVLRPFTSQNGHQWAAASQGTDVTRDGNTGASASTV